MLGILAWQVGRLTSAPQALLQPQTPWPLPASLPPHLLPTSSQGENVHEPNFGCKAVQAEWEWSGRRALMARRCMQDLVKAAEVRGRPGAAAGFWVVFSAWQL